MPHNYHLYVALSGHGFGHLAQVAPVLNAWRRRHPDGQLTVQSVIPAAVLRARITGPFHIVVGAADFGMLMANALEVKVAESLAAYRAFHTDWNERLAWQIQLLQDAAPDVVFADIPYLTLVAAQHLKIPALALCSLHWADILTDYCGKAPDILEFCATMRAAYNSTVAFLQPAPSMPMLGLTNRQPIGPIAERGHDHRAAINARLGLQGDETLVVIALGGFDMRPPLEQWPTFPGVVWLTPPAWHVTRADMPNWSIAADGSMLDLMRSCDVVFTKPGYGAFAEAACNGTRVLSVAREDWPEAPWLNRWLDTHGHWVEITHRQCAAGDLAEALRSLLAQRTKSPVLPTGVEEAADWLDRCR